VQKIILVSAAPREFFLQEAKNLAHASNHKFIKPLAKAIACFNCELFSQKNPELNSQCL
jgi:hypothetical protein